MPYVYRQRSLIIILLWSILVIASLSWNILNQYRNTETLLIDTARANFFKDQAFRLWASMHGGVYVPANKVTPPNSNLGHLPDRDITTPSGRVLTLMNPAYMVRQMFSLFPGYYGVTGRITSLRPINPDNAPDPWEADALHEFERGVEEVVAFTELGGEPVLRLMRPMITRSDCLKCHTKHGYQEGDVRGGVGVVVPAKEFISNRNQTILRLVISYALVWLVGLGGILWFSSRLQKFFQALKKNQELLEHKVMKRTSDLEETTRMFRTMVEFTNDWEYWVAPNQKILYMSPSCQLVSGYSHQEFEADPTLIVQVIHHQDRPMYVQHLQENHPEGKDPDRIHQTTFRIVTRSGQIRKIEHVCRAVRGEQGEYLGRRVSNRDITDRVRLQERLSHLMEALPTLLVEVDHLDRVILWNQAAEQILGLPREQVLGNHFLDLPLQWEWPILFDALDRAITKGEVVILPRLRYVHPHGHAIHLELTLFGYDEQADRKIMLLGSDITEKLTMETRAFQASKLEAVGTLAAGIAHEINTPVQFIGGGIYFLKEAFMLLSELSEKSVENANLTQEEKESLEFYRQEIPASLEQIKEGVNRITTIVGAMKAFSYSSGTDFSPADLNQALNNTLVIARNEIKYVADVALDLDPDIPAVPCLLHEINQVILNLVINAAHAIRDNLENLDNQRGTIRLVSRCVGNNAVIQVCDNGAGIPKEIQDRVFEPFFTTKPVGQGTGQGLAICHAVVCRHHGGTITFESQLGVGTCFTVTLPLQRKPSSKEPVAWKNGD